MSDMLTAAQRADLGLQELTINNRTITCGAKGLANYRNLKWLSFRGCTISHFHPQALKSGKGKGSVAVANTGPRRCSWATSTETSDSRA